MTYTEVNVNVNGCAESTQYFDDTENGVTMFRNSISATQRFAYDNSDFDVEIYVLHHPHEQGIDCECIQYEQSHKPYWERKGDKPESVKIVSAGILRNSKSFYKVLDESEDQ